MEWLTDPRAWIGLATLVALEIVLGVDNIVFISILSSKLPAAQQERARKLGIGLAVGTRILLLLTLAWIIGLTRPLFTAFGFAVSGRDLILGLGGLFLIYKATKEIHEKLEGDQEQIVRRTPPTFAAVIVQILLLDVIFSLDSVITAVGMVDEIAVMVIAIMIAALFMLLSARKLADFISRHPTIKILALSFLLLIGLTLMLEGFHQHVPKGYIYFAMGFSVLVEILNLRTSSRNAAPVVLHEPRP